MSMYDSSFFPQTNVHEINLDWILTNVKNNNEIVNTINNAYTSGQLSGKNFAIIDILENWSQLTSIVDPKAGDCYAVGKEPPYTCYMWINNDWQSLGNLSGENGKDGENGKSASVTIGTTSTTMPGTNANVVNTGTETDVILNFSIPRGEKGEQGEKGENGTNGENGKDGANGTGVASGGNNGDVLVKNSDADFSTSWKAQTEIAPVRSVNGATGNVIIPLASTTQMLYEVTGSGQLIYTTAESKSVKEFKISEAGTYLAVFCFDMSGINSSSTMRIVLSFGQTLRQSVASNTYSPSTTIQEILPLPANSNIIWYVTCDQTYTLNYSNMIFSLYKLP